VARRATKIAALMGTATNPILVDAGDQFQGSLYYTQYRGDEAAEFMPLLGYQAMTIGNHEFDDGPANLARFIDRSGCPCSAPTSTPAATRIWRARFCPSPCST
jgi:5'-nucleotidase/UDP-sugar diphosphatase